MIILALFQQSLPKTEQPQNRRYFKFYLKQQKLETIIDFFSFLNEMLCILPS